MHNHLHRYRNRIQQKKRNRIWQNLIVFKNSLQTKSQRALPHNFKRNVLKPRAYVMFNDKILNTLTLSLEKK